MPGNDHLARRIEIDRLHDFTLGGIRTNAFDSVVFHPQNGSHFALTTGAGIAHQFATTLHQRYTIRQRDRVGADIGGVFSQTMTRHQGGPNIGRLAPGTPCSNAGNQHDGLGDFRLCQFLLGALLCQRPHIATEYVGRFIEGLLHDGKGFVEIGQHTHRLGALTWKDKRDLLIHVLSL